MVVPFFFMVNSSKEPAVCATRTDALTAVTVNALGARMYPTEVPVVKFVTRSLTAIGSTNILLPLYPLQPDIPEYPLIPDAPENPE